MRRPPLVVNVADLLRRPGSRRHVTLQVALDGLKVLDCWVPEGAQVDVDLTLESLPEGIVATGRVQAPWVGSCRRCLGGVDGEVVAQVRELFEAHPADELSYPIVGEQVDLEPLVREAVGLELPLAPLCGPDCAGLCPTCGADRNESNCGHDGEVVDERWADLGELRFGNN